MTRKQIIELLGILEDAYPNIKFKNPEGTVTTWEMAFGSEDAEKVYKAARYHISKSPFFPTVADIKKAIPKGQLLFSEQDRLKIAPTAPMKKIDPNATFCDLCELCDIRNQTYCPFDV